MITINGAIEVDVHGQVVADTIGGRQYSGIGGPRDFMPPRGSSSRTVRSCASLDGDDRRRGCGGGSCHVRAGAVITTPRHQLDVIVTEHGVAELQGLTVHQRGLALAEIAHPDFRDELVEAAERASKGNPPFGQ